MKNINSCSTTRHGVMLGRGICGAPPGVIRGKSEVQYRSKESVFIKNIQIPTINLNLARTVGMRKTLKHPEFSLMSPMPFEKNAEIIKRLINHVIAGHVFMEEEVLHGNAVYEGKPVTLGFLFSGSKSDSEFSVHFFDENAQYIGFPTQEQIDWVGKNKG